MQYELKNSFLKVVVSSHGAELQSVQDVHSGYEFLWQADPKVWGRHAPILFPIVGRLKQDRYQYAGQDYDLSQHGFARDQEFKLVSQTDDSLTLELAASEETLAKYPFAFRLQVNYSLLNNLLEENFRVINEDDKEMIFGIGGHPGFNLPVANGLTKRDFFLECHPSEDRILIPLENSLLNWDERTLAITDTPIELSDDLFKDDALILQLSGHDNKFSIKTDKSDFHINVWTRNAPFVGFWSQYPQCANYVCIEPWWGIADRLDHNQKLEDKYGMNHLAAGQEFAAGFSMAFHR